MTTQSTVAGDTVPKRYSKKDTWRMETEGEGLEVGREMEERNGEESREG